ncbi:twin-arginine translocation signal domain-containing protein [Natronococcus jeotgali]|uniref:twin-arginine translocation signal domain-containing protein n=1 Tax=Natronococcus jeotgali TaxID=413812 RepID=UPI000A05C341|nr:twin-arginine translocation signal domain-containing protein [Natronococcus jeotgali]
MLLPDPSEVSRREYLKAAVAVGGATGLSACLDILDEQTVPSGAEDPSTLPTRQHAWNAVLDTDDDSNREPPRHHVLSPLEYVRDGPPDDAGRDTVETALRTLERAYEWSHEGLLFTIGYSPAYFDRFDADLPESVDLPYPEPLSSLEEPMLDDADAILHLASDVPSVPLAAEEALFGEADTVNDVDVDTDLSGVFKRTGRRPGFVGEGLPAENQDVQGIPDSEPVPEEAALFMGFRSIFERNQATEDRVTIKEGPFADGTTQHVETDRLQLQPWYEQDSHYQRVAKMFSPEHAKDELVGEVGEKLENSARITDEIIDHIEQDAHKYGMVGHAQKVARGREDGQPLLLRRDFNTTDGDRAGLHFLSLQRRISDFIRTRELMNGEQLATDTAVGQRLNNGILQYVFVERRGSFLIPPRPHRALPEATPDP